MDPLPALLVAVAAAALVVACGWHACSRIPDVLGGLFRAPELGWPRGVQEEEPVAWNWSPARVQAHDEFVELDVRADRVTSRIDRGRARRGHW